MTPLVVFGFILAFINPVVGGVLVGYIVWHNSPAVGFQIITLSFTMVILYGIGFIIWAIKKFRKLEERINEITSDTLSNQ